MEFQIGDHVIGKPEADEHYRVTRAGAEWIVIKVTPVRFKKYPSIQLATLENYAKYGTHSTHYDVSGRYFEHVFRHNKDLKHRLEGSELY